jgi:hypothetical protein
MGQGQDSLKPVSGPCTYIQAPPPTALRSYGDKLRASAPYNISKGGYTNRYPVSNGDGTYSSNSAVSTARALAPVNCVAVRPLQNSSTQASAPTHAPTHAPIHPHTHMLPFPIPHAHT